MLRQRHGFVAARSGAGMLAHLPASCCRCVHRPCSCPPLRRHRPAVARTGDAGATARRNRELQHHRAKLRTGRRETARAVGIECDSSCASRRGRLRFAPLHFPFSASSTAHAASQSLRLVRSDARFGRTRVLTGHARTFARRTNADTLRERSRARLPSRRWSEARFPRPL
jgi:hypothetical protein